MSMALTSTKKLRLAHRDLRVIAFGMGATRRISVVEFAHGVLARYLRRRTQGPAPELALWRPRHGVTIQNAHHYAHTHLAPRLSLTVLDWRTRSLSGGAAGSLTPRLCV